MAAGEPTSGMVLVLDVVAKLIEFVKLRVQRCSLDVSFWKVIQPS
jgi:hypothetical protein